MESNANTQAEERRELSAVKRGCPCPRQWRGRSYAQVDGEKVRRPMPEFLRLFLKRCKSTMWRSLLRKTAASIRNADQPCNRRAFSHSLPLPSATKAMLWMISRLSDVAPWHERRKPWRHTKTRRDVAREALLKRLNGPNVPWHDSCESASRKLASSNNALAPFH